MSGLRQTHRVRQLAHVQAPRQRNLSLLSACDMRNQRRSPRSPGREEREEGELEGRGQGSWGEGANLVILSAAAAAANSTSSGEVETEQHKITRVMKTSGIAAQGRTWGKNE